MAQDPDAIVGKANRKHQWMKRLNLEQETQEDNLISRLADRTRDPTAPYYSSNFEILSHYDPVGMAVDELIATISSDGYVFQLDDGTFCYPSDDFKSIFSRYWLGFATKSIRFISAKGYLVWYIVQTQNGLLVPEVADPARIHDVFYTEETTLNTGIRASWKHADHASIPLFVLDTGLHTVVNPTHRVAPIDRCKKNIAMDIHMDNCRIMTLRRIAHPQIMLKTTEEKNTNGIHPSRLAISEGVANEFMRYADKMGDDDLALLRVQNAVNGAHQFNPISAVSSIPPALRTYADITKDLAQNYQYIPVGMEPHEMHRNVSESLDYPAVRKMVFDDIRRVFGLEGSATAVPAAAPGSTPGGQASSGSSKKHSPIMRQWTETISYVLTTVFRILHQQSAIKVGDVKPTYRQEIARVSKVDNVKGMQITPIIIPEQPAPPPPKRAPGEEDRDDEEDNDRDKVKHINKKLRVTTTDHPDHTQRDKPSSPPAEANTEGDEMHRPSGGITIRPLSMILDDRDNAASFMQQGGISEDRFFELHPLVTVKPADDHEKEAERKKEEAERKKEEDAIAKEREMLRKEEMKDHKRKLHEMESEITRLKNDFQRAAANKT